MCGIAGIFKLDHSSYRDLDRHLQVMNKIQAYRGPDGEGTWTHKNNFIGLAHRRLSIIDLRTGAQPMMGNNGNIICYNGEIYNYIELKEELTDYQYRTTSDTEVILAAYQKWGSGCVAHLKGMFSFAIWDEAKKQLFCARDRFGIKPFYYAIQDGVFYFASESKTLLPFLKEVTINLEALKEYLVFQFYLNGKTLFGGINELLPAHQLTVKDGKPRIERYWEVYYNLDFNHPAAYFEEKLRFLLTASVQEQVRSDVPVGAYLSGGIDSSLIASLSSQYLKGQELQAFHGRFLSPDNAYDESKYAALLAAEKGFTLHQVDITSRDFAEVIQKVIYHLDYPIAGPGSFPQFMVSKLAASHRKVVLGGQGGDEVFGGYVRYLIAYFEQCIKGAIDGTLHNGNFVVTYESIIPNLPMLSNYKPLLQEFWQEGLFESLDKRYFRLVNRATHLGKEINWQAIGEFPVFETFQGVFNGNNVGKESYFDKMTHFDFKTLLPALLHVEDRMSMAHGLESRVPFLDHEVVEFAATIPADIKFKDGKLKMILLDSMKSHLPEGIVNRKDKMGFPVPLIEWSDHELKDFIFDIFNTPDRFFLNKKEIIKNISKEPKFGRKLWGLLSLELWCREFIDKQQHYKKMIA
ncbi:MAG: asparagine synthase (glutamine-hydrolyzing) [bacterium]|nr:asparagine synthase (glutamine-hydrolyzing) [bacterium]